MEYREQQIQMLKRETGFDENVIGCFLSNFGKRHICPIATGKWCRDYEKCKCMKEGIMRKIEAQQAHNEAMSSETSKTPIKTILAMTLLVFIALCILTVLVELAKLGLYGITEIRCVEVVILLVLYVIVSLMAAGLLYHIMQREKL